MKELKLTGGARIGMANATFPFATLKVNKDQLELNATIVGNLTFQSSDVISIEPFTKVPLLGKGIRIHHNVANYKKEVIFWTFKDPNSVVDLIHETGFFNKENNASEGLINSIREKQAIGGFPVKKGVAIGMIVAWNLLFLMDIIPFFLQEKEGFPIGNGALAALGLVFLTAFLSLVSSGFRRLILKDGRGLNDIRKFSIFIMVISGFMLLQFVFMTKIMD